MRAVGKYMDDEEVRRNVEVVRGAIERLRRERPAHAVYKEGVLWVLAHCEFSPMYLCRLAERAGSRSKDGDKKCRLAAEILLAEALGRLPEYRQGTDANGDEVILIEEE
jgi:hypothetical protein